MGDMLLASAEEAPDRQILVLCGHTHSPGIVDILPNLRVCLNGESLAVDERKDRDRLLRRSRFFLAGGIAPEFISNTDGRDVGGRCAGWRGFARVEFSSSLLE